MGDKVWEAVAVYQDDGPWKRVVRHLNLAGVKAWGSRLYRGDPVTVCVDPKDLERARGIVSRGGFGDGRR